MLGGSRLFAVFVLRFGERFYKKDKAWDDCCFLLLCGGVFN